MVVQANKHKTGINFQIGDLVFLKLQPYCQNSLVAREVLKLVAKYFGPYKALYKIGSYGYRLHLPSSTIMRPVIHVSQLKATLTIEQEVATLSPSALPTARLTPLAILSRRTVKGATGQLHNG